MIRQQRRILGRTSVIHLTVGRPEFTKCPDNTVITAGMKCIEQKPNSDAVQPFACPAIALHYCCHLVSIHLSPSIPAYRNNVIHHAGLVELSETLIKRLRAVRRWKMRTAISKICVTHLPVTVSSVVNDRV